MATWTTKLTGDVIAAAWFNDLQTGKVDSDGTATPTFATGTIIAGLPYATKPTDSFWIGSLAPDVTTPHYDTFFGLGAGEAITDGEANCGIGATALMSLTTGKYNTAVGADAMRLAVSGDDNSCFGVDAGYQLTTGSYNTAIGKSALHSTGSAGTGDYNVGVGYYALSALTSGVRNVGVGALALTALTTGEQNVSVGDVSMTVLTTGKKNVGIGAGTFAALTSAEENVAVGYRAGAAITTTTGIALFGSMAGFNINGNYNTACGAYALYTAGAVAGNVALGFGAGFYETGANKLFIDNATRASEADGRAKALVYGVFDAATANQRFRINGRLGVTEVPAYANNAAAEAGGLAVGEVYRTNADPSVLCIRSA